MANVKSQSDLSTLWHNQAHPGIIQAYSGILRTLCNPGIFKTAVYPKLIHVHNNNHIQWHIQNPSMFRTLVYLKSLAQTEPCQIFTMKRSAKIVNGYNYFYK